MKVAVFTYTRDRLDYTREAFASLREKAGHPYDHFVVDNASSDGTQQYLRDLRARGEVCDLCFNAANAGLHVSATQALARINQGVYDLAIKFDNDCRVVTDGVLARIVDLYATAVNPRMILSPRVEGIGAQPERVATVRTAQGLTFGMTGHVGGIFLCARIEFWNRVPIEYSMPLGWGDDLVWCFEARRMNYVVGYVEDLVVEHMDGVEGQYARYPEYYARKRDELPTGLPPAVWADGHDRSSE